MVAAFERISRAAPRVVRRVVVTTAVCAALLVVGCAAATSPASAGEYHVYSCRTPSGEPAPADGWSGSAIGPESIDQDTCSQPGGALIAGLRGGFARTANSDSAKWAFEAPAGEAIAAATLWRAGDADGGAAIDASYQFSLAGPSEVESFDACSYLAGCFTGVGAIGQPLSPENRMAEPTSNLGSHLYATASCGGVSPYSCPTGDEDPNGYAAVVYLYAADLTLEQTAPPTASNVSGELATASTVSGTSDVAFSASDPGSGVYEAVFSVDGKVVQSTVLNEDGGRCRNVGGTSDGLTAFLYVQPCPASVSADVGFDTAAVANGVAPPGGERDRRGGQRGDGARQERDGREPGAAGRAERCERVVPGVAVGELDRDAEAAIGEPLRPRADDYRPSDGRRTACRSWRRR